MVINVVKEMEENIIKDNNTCTVHIILFLVYIIKFIKNL
jgi:hypothetical protein